MVVRAPSIPSLSSLSYRCAVEMHPAQKQGPPRPSSEDRPIVSRGAYDLSFFDGDNEYDRPTEGEMHRNPELYNREIARFSHLMEGGSISDEAFAREFPYERLLQLDEALTQRGGLSASRMRQLFRPTQGVEAACCAICLEKCGAQDLVAVLQCTHVFHYGCVERWFESHRTCPLCRFEVAA